MSADPREPSGARSLGQAEEQARLTQSGDDAPSPLGAAVQEVSQKASLLVREEIALARAEVTQKATRLGKGAAVAAVAGVIAVGGLIMLLHTIAWFFAWVIGEANLLFFGFLITAVILFVLAGIAAAIGMRMIKRGAPPTPDMAIEEAKRIRETVQTS